MGSRQEFPASPEEAGELLRDCAAGGLRLRARGGGTKLGWGCPVPDADVDVMTGQLDRVIEHNAGDLTAVLQAGVPLATAQQVFAAAGQTLARGARFCPTRPVFPSTPAEATGTPGLTLTGRKTMPRGIPGSVRPVPGGLCVAR